MAAIEESKGNEGLNQSLPRCVKHVLFAFSLNLLQMLSLIFASPGEKHAAASCHVHVQRIYLLSVFSLPISHINQTRFLYLRRKAVTENFHLKDGRVVLKGGAEV